MSKYQYDVTIIGGGSAGLVAARISAALGARVCLIDKKELGGDCLHFGCVPSKTLIHAAKIVKTAREASNLVGLDNAEMSLQVDMHKVATRIKGVIERIGEAEAVYVKGVDVKFGEVNFKAAHQLELNGATVTSQAFVIASGSSPRIPDVPGLAETGYLTNQSIFDLLHLPTSLIVVGGGPIGVEMAQAFARLGSKVTIMQGPEHILPKEEPEVSKTIAEVLEAENVKIVTKARLKKAWTENNRKVIEVSQGEATLRFEADELLIATGRVPNVDGLNLEAAGVKFSKDGIEVNEYLQTSAENVFAAGDVLGGLYFTHVAAYQAGIAVRNILVPIGRKKVDYRVIPWVTFTDPEAAHVGLTEAEAREKYDNKIKIVVLPWHEIDRAQTEGETTGFIKLVLNEKSEEIYGAHLVGSHSGEVLAEVALAMQHKLGISGILDTVHAYPTLATGLQSAAFEAYLASKAVSNSSKLLKPVLAIRG